MNFTEFFAKTWPLTDQSRGAVSEILRLYQSGRKGVQFMTDEDRWVTTENKHRVLIGEDGTIKAGFGGKFNGKKLDNVSQSYKLQKGWNQQIKQLEGMGFAELKGGSRRHDLEFARGVQQELKNEALTIARSIDPDKTDRATMTPEVQAQIQRAKECIRGFSEVTDPGELNNIFFGSSGAEDPKPSTSRYREPRKRGPMSEEQKQRRKRVMESNKRQKELMASGLAKFQAINQIRRENGLGDLDDPIF